MVTHYCVARHTYRIIFEDGGRNDERLIPSSAPFRRDWDGTDDQLLFTLTVDDSFRPQERGKEIGQFDCGGNNHGVYRLDDGSYRVQVSDPAQRQCCLLVATPDFRRGTVALNGTAEMRSFGLNNALMMMYAFAAAEADTLLMHASVVREAGIGYLFLGKSGTGKSTHTAGWLRHVPCTDLMNDDNPVVRIVDGRAMVFGSPWSGKTPCYRDVEAPVGGFVQLVQAPHNKMRRQSVVEAFVSLLPSCSVMKWDARDYRGACATVTRLMETAPTFVLENLPDEAAVRLSHDTLVAAQTLRQ